MGRNNYGTGTIVKRGKIWYVTYWADGKQIQKSSGSTNIQDAKKLRDQIWVRDMKVRNRSSPFFVA